MRKRQELGESMCTKTEVETVIGLLAAAHLDQPVTSFDLLRSVVADGCRSLDRRLQEFGPLEPERFRLQT
jgi:hypothetical protein